MKNLAEELHQQRRLRVLEIRMTDCCEERHDISEALSNGALKSDQKLRYECRVTEIGLEMAALWCEYRKLAKSAGFQLDDDGLF